MGLKLARTDVRGLPRLPLDAWPGPYVSLCTGGEPPIREHCLLLSGHQVLTAPSPATARVRSCMSELVRAVFNPSLPELPVPQNSDVRRPQVVLHRLSGAYRGNCLSLTPEWVYTGLFVFLSCTVLPMPRRKTHPIRRSHRGKRASTSQPAAPEDRIPFGGAVVANELPHHSL
ncbi:hypothetical protein C8F01DRAFT_1167703 [Mycena amicta]|nr:hypothetical protein C8F01DRAFT_1167703 [Mycena amicta]